MRLGKSICLVVIFSSVLLGQLVSRSVASPSHSIIAFDQDGTVVLRKDFSKHTYSRFMGISPVISPSGDAVAFLRSGNVFILNLSSDREKQLTHFPPGISPESFDMHIAWHPSEKWIVFTMEMPFLYDARRGVLRSVSKPTHAAFPISTLWFADVHLGRAYMIVGPTSFPVRRWHENTLDAANLLEPIFSPDGKFLWFISPGNIYELNVGKSGIRCDVKPRLVANLGKLDTEGPGASKWGRGPRQLAWDGVSSRLCYWIGRYWGTGESSYGYLQWRHGDLEKPVKWNPQFAHEIRKAFPNIEGCEFDNTGHLWVRALVEDKSRWIRQDSKVMLPVGAGRPSFRASGTVPFFAELAQRK